MLDHTPDVDCQYGAPMGRGFRSDQAVALHMAGMFTPRPEAELAPMRAAFDGKVSLQHVPLDSGGYDRGGAYWGHGGAIYSALSSCGRVDMTMRAANREVAKKLVQDIYPKAKFYL